MTTSTRTETKRTGGLLVYLLVLVSLQIFLLVIAVEGITAHDPGPARAAAVLSITLFISAVVLRWFLHDG